MVYGLVALPKLEGSVRMRSVRFALPAPILLEKLGLVLLTRFFWSARTLLVFVAPSKPSFFGPVAVLFRDEFLDDVGCSLPEL